MNLFTHYDLARLFIFKRAPKAAAPAKEPKASIAEIKARFPLASDKAPAASPRKSLKDFLYDLMEGLPGEARDQLLKMRGGCGCHGGLGVSCGPCSDPLTLDEADALELLEEGEYALYTINEMPKAGDLVMWLGCISHQWHPRKVIRPVGLSGVRVRDQNGLEFDCDASEWRLPTDAERVQFAPETAGRYDWEGHMKTAAKAEVARWFAHNGGACPVDPETFVDRRYPSQEGREPYDKPIKAKHVAWDRVSSYRVVSQ